MGTITPFQNATLANYYDAAKEAKREQLNAFIRSAPYWDGIVDFEKALQDPANPLMCCRPTTAAITCTQRHGQPGARQRGPVGASRRASRWPSRPEPVGGTVPATLALTMGAAPDVRGVRAGRRAQTYTRLDDRDGDLDRGRRDAVGQPIPAT